MATDEDYPIYGTNIPICEFSGNYSDFNLTDCGNMTAFNITDMMSHTHYKPPYLVVEFAKILYGIVFMVGLCGNSLVLYVVLRFSKMQTVTNMYIFNLALADEMFLTGLPFLITTMVFGYWPFGSVMCKIYMTTTSINQFTSSLLLTVMSADRYVAVCHPISSPRYRTPFIAKFICLTAWTVSALLMVPIYIYANIYHTGTSLSCNIYWPESDLMNGQKAFTLYSFTLGFAIPLILILLFYFLVICKLRTVGPKNRSKEKKRSHRKVTYLVLTVITVYVICWLPYWITQVYITLLPPRQGQSQIGFIIILLAGMLAYANSAMNPILYAFLSDNFKKSFAKAFTCAARMEVNAQLNVENSVFPKNTRSGSSKAQLNREQKQRNELDPSTAITLTSRSNIVMGDKEFSVRNGFNKQKTESEPTQV
ncbi:somatostatin receptor type 2-like [Parasteatoda tepidariorum]|uniref:somatostatin receptor type 2-like n=1 Tax=Parasteatoda tepidariorum TaxID=114398 RepID=UPI00077F849A|nr:somatostatin receptor type 2-like [Parasteatoda tepidariorum]XP_042894976.1 somatostatin receptor type 2-like [Parasteatoda tepidariorum]